MATLAVNTSNVSHAKDSIPGPTTEELTLTTPCVIAANRAEANPLGLGRNRLGHGIMFVVEGVATSFN